MIIYSDLEYQLTCKDFIKLIDDLISNVKEKNLTDHDSLRKLFIRFGEFHTAAADVLFVKEEYNHPVIIRFSQGEIYLAKVLLSSWSKKRKDIEQEFDSFISLYKKIPGHCIEGPLKGKVAEGFSFYAYYPEAFFNTAEKFYNDYKPDEVYCIGIRSIGTSLSAASAAMLDKKGCTTHLVTFKTRGDFENRYLSVNKNFLEKITASKNAYYLITDEGPGLSGSSFGVTASMLSEAGVPDDRIVFFSTWDPAAEDLRSEKGKTAWNKHRKYFTTFEELWIESSKLKEVFNYKDIKDLSSGKWVNEFNPPGAVPVDKADERKKFLLVEDNDSFVIKFAGLNGNGENIYQRMKLLSENDFIPEIKSFNEGFIKYKFVEGTSLTVVYRDKKFFNFASAYFSFIMEHFPTEVTQDKEDSFNMILENCSELMGEDMTKRLESKKEFFLNGFLLEGAFIDGNVLPHEWIKTKSGYCKLDSGEHAANHMFPGCQNILWDIAAFIIEFELNEEEQNKFIGSFVGHSEKFQTSFPYYAVAYSAFRMAFCSVKADVYEKNHMGEVFANYKKKYMQIITDYIDVL